jgi:hypothetical protein
MPSAIHTPPDRSPSIRLRLSNEVNAAVEFTAQDADTLAAGCERALRQFRAEHGAGRLVLQVRPPGGVSGDAWFAPIGTRGPVEILVNEALLEQRRDDPDAWRHFWTWIRTERQAARDTNALARTVTDDAGADRE